MSGLTVYCCGPIPRLRRLLETVDGIARLADWRELETIPSVGRCLFAVGMDDLGPLPETTELLRFIRPERKFASVEELKGQLAHDAEQVSGWFRTHLPEFFGR